MTYSQVLQRLGPPEEMYADDGEVHWNFPNGTIIFCDGLVGRLELWTEEGGELE